MSHYTLPFHCFLFLHSRLDLAGWVNSFYLLYLFCLPAVYYSTFPVSVMGYLIESTWGVKNLFPLTLKTRVFSPRLLEQTIMVQECVVEGKFLPDARQEVERKPLSNVIMSWIPQGVNLLITFQLSWSNCFWKHHRYTQRCAPRIPCVVFDVIKVTELTLTGSWTFLCPGNGLGTLLCFRHYTVENLIPKGALCIVHCKQKLIAAPQIFGCL